MKRPRIFSAAHRQGLFARGACLAGTAVLLLSSISARADDLDVAFSSLVSGRAYLQGFPSGGKDRDAVVNDFTGANGQSPNRPMLIDAIQRAVQIRASEPLDPPTFPAGQAPRSVLAKVIAWESLEALLTGYLYAGNRDLLNATRVAYPGSDSSTDTRGLPMDEPAELDLASQKQITYARLYFLQGIKDVLSYIAEDTTGQLRAGGGPYPTVPHYVTFDEQITPVLPWPQFDDPNFGGPAVQDREPSQAIAYLHGSAMERLSLAAVSYADQLWRSAYAGPLPGMRRTETEKNQMLQRATDVLKESIHAQFLASLPLAAQLSDGSGGGANEFYQSKIDQARPGATSALRLREQILAGEKPTQAALVTAWDVVAIGHQISRVNDAFESARLKWGGDSDPAVDGSVAQALRDQKAALSENAGRQIQLRNSIESQLYEITGVDPALYGGLRTEVQRAAYTNEVNRKFTEALNAQNPNAPELKDGSLMSVQALRLIQAIQEAVAATAQWKSFPERALIELERNNEVNATIAYYANETGIIDDLMIIADSIKFSVCVCGTASGTRIEASPNAIAHGYYARMKAIRQGDQNIEINSSNSAAVIKNLYIEMDIAYEQMRAVELNSAIAGAELRHQLARAQRLVEDHVFLQDITDTLWYRDPSLAFKLEKAEEEYQSLMQEFRIELYKLAKMLEAAWTERFQNPIKQANGFTTEPLNGGSFDEFTEAESVFSVPNHVRGQRFMSALKAWDLRLRDPLFRGPHSDMEWDANTFTGQPISLRRDIFKLLDYRYDIVGNRYDVDPALTRQTINQFRAILLNLAARDPKNANGLTRLRIDFPLTYNQARVILGQAQPVPIVQQHRPSGTFDEFWNHRVTQLGIKIVGKNVFAAGATVPVAFELYGNVDRIGFFPDSLHTFSRTMSSFPVPLYQSDPDDIGAPFLGASIDAAIGSTQVQLFPVIGWPLFCDNMVLRVGSQGTLRIENIDDIELYMEMEVGPPPPITAPW